MKQLLLGNAAITRGLYEAGCRFVSAYPGTPSTEITEAAAKYDEVYAEWSPNEKVAYEAALGASIAGARSFCAMKHVGLNVAADPMFTSSYTGVNAGLVVCVADDPGMHSSQNEQDSRHYARAAKLPMLEPSDSAECVAFTKLAFELSERFDTPVLLRTSTRVAHSQSLCELSERINAELKDYVKDPAKYVMAPSNAKGRHVVVEKRMEALLEYAEACPLNEVHMGDTSIGIVVSGACYQYAREALPNASFLKLGMVYPLPIRLIKSFAKKVDKLYVIEELDPFIETQMLANGIDITGGKDMFGLIGELSQYKIKAAMGLELPETEAFPAPIPPRPPIMCPGCPHRGLFYVLGKLKLTVLGDIGCYTLGSMPPLNAIDTVVCMGASISSLHGFTKVRPEALKNAVAVIGDSTFMHSGVAGLMDIAYNLNHSTVIVLDNSITGMTGHQQNPATGLTLKQEPTPVISIEAICRAMGIERVRVIDPYDLARTEQAIREELAIDAPSVIIARRPCALLKYVKRKPALIIDGCKGCKACMKLGCQAIHFTSGKAEIDHTLCVGCGLCKSLCAFDAIRESGAIE